MRCEIPAYEEHADFKSFAKACKPSFSECQKHAGRNLRSEYALAWKQPEAALLHHVWSGKELSEKGLMALQNLRPRLMAAEKKRLGL